MNSIQEGNPTLVDVYNQKSSEIRKLEEQELFQQTRLANIEELMRKNFGVQVELAQLGIEILDHLNDSILNNLTIFKQDFIPEFQKRITNVRGEIMANFALITEGKQRVVEGGQLVTLTEEKRMELVIRFMHVMDEKIEEFMNQIPEEMDMVVFRNKFTAEIADNTKLQDQLYNSTRNIFVQITDLVNRQEVLIQKREAICNPPIDQWIAVQEGNLPYIKQMCPILKKKSFLDAQERSTGMTMLHYAAQAGQMEIVNWLIEKKASRNILNDAGYFPVHLAAKYGHLEIVQALCLRGNYLNEKGIYDRTPLHMAAFNGHPEIVRWLIAAGAPLHSKTTEEDGQQTPLHQAVFKEHTAVVAEFTQSSKLNIQIPDANGQTPFYQAIFAGAVEIATLLMAHSSWRCPIPGDPNYAVFDLTPGKNPEEIRNLLNGLRPS